MFPGNTKEKQALSRPMQQLLIETENLKHETKKREEIAKKHDVVYVDPFPTECQFLAGFVVSAPWRLPRKPTAWVCCAAGTVVSV